MPPPSPLRAQADRCLACELSTLIWLPGDGVGDVCGRRQAQGARVIGWTSLCWPDLPHVVPLSPQGDSGEMGFPGMAGLFGPKVQIPTLACSYWGPIHPLPGLFLHVLARQRFLELSRCGLESLQNQAGTSLVPRTHLPTDLVLSLAQLICSVH